MYYICKFRGTWSIYDGKKGVDRILEKAEADCLQVLFPSLLADTSALVALQISSISPNKLQQLTSAADGSPRSYKNK